MMALFRRTLGVSMMSIAESKSTFTIDELLAMPNGEDYELVDGQLVEVHMSNLSSSVGANIIGRLTEFNGRENAGTVFDGHSYYQCFPMYPGHARKPDASFISKARLPANWLAEGYFRIAPDLAVEVVSQHDSRYEVESKIQEYLDANVRLVWEINPEQRVIYVHRLDGSVAKLRENDTLSGEDVLPGFACRVGDLFPPAPAAADMASP